MKRIMAETELSFHEETCRKYRERRSSTVTMTGSGWLWINNNVSDLPPPASVESASVFRPYRSDARHDFLSMLRDVSATRPKARAIAKPDRVESAFDRSGGLRACSCLGLPETEISSGLARMRSIYLSRFRCLSNWGSREAYNWKER